MANEIQFSEKRQLYSELWLWDYHSLCIIRGVFLTLHCATHCLILVGSTMYPEPLVLKRIKWDNNGFTTNLVFNTNSTESRSVLEKCRVKTRARMKGRKMATTMAHQQYINEMKIEETSREGDATATPPVDEKMEKLIKHQLLRFARKRRAYCKNGMYLAIDKNGVHGTKDPNNPYAELLVLSIGSDMLAIWGIRASLYLAVDSSTGKIYTTPDEGKHCVFIETLLPDFYNIYESYHSVCDDRPQCIELNAQNKLVLSSVGQIPARNGQFILKVAS